MRGIVNLDKKPSDRFSKVYRSVSMMTDLSSSEDTANSLPRPSKTLRPFTQLGILGPSEQAGCTKCRYRIPEAVRLQGRIKRHYPFSVCTRFDRRAVELTSDMHKVPSAHPTSFHDSQIVSLISQESHSIIVGGSAVLHL
jgi:hypothetical protein